jgi:hypothetical protein
MAKSRLFGAVCASILTFATTNSHAILESRLGGLAYYDTDAELTWLADANINGEMNWADANAWAAGLNVAGITGWRLPDTLQPDSSCDGQTGGRSDGTNCTGSEMGNLFYNVLGGVANSSLTATHNSNYDLFTNATQNSFYWSATEYNIDHAWLFDFGNGSQNCCGGKDNPYFAWAVQSGDVSAIPIPAAAWLFGSGLLGLIGAARNIKAA